MNKRAGLAAILAATCVAALVAAIPLRAEDTDLESTVYMVFDPETGELITVEEPAGPRITHDLTDTAAARFARDSDVDPAASIPSSLLLGSILALGLLAGAIAWIRKNRKIA